jgi:hypothetical protein
MNAIPERYFPRTICVSDSGLVSSSTIVPVWRSSAKSRIVTNTAQVSATPPVR